MGLVLIKNPGEEYTQKELEQMVKREVVAKIQTVGIEDWVDSFFDEGSVEEVI